MKTISIEKFKSLNHTVQYDIVHYFGAFVGQYRKSGYLLALYQLHSFYVEVVFKSEKLVALNCYLSPDEIDRYLKQIDISELGLMVSDY